MNYITVSDVFQSTLPARGATVYADTDSCKFIISIHAPRTGSDFLAGLYDFADVISIHAPRTGSDMLNTHSPGWILPFQSTLPARGATTLWSGEVLTS